MGQRQPASLLERFWLSDWSLSALLALLIIDGFVLAPLLESEQAPRVVAPVVFSLIIVSGIAVTFRSRVTTALIGALAAVSLAVRWANHVHPNDTLALADALLTLAFLLMLVAVLLVQVFRAGPVTLHRVQGAIAVYLLLAYGWAMVYELVAMGDPAAFSFPATGIGLQRLFARLLYFSTVTLTTVGYGDITPVSPVARSLATLEALTGQLFPAILLARLVSMELYHRQQGDR